MSAETQGAEALLTAERRELWRDCALEYVDDPDATPAAGAFARAVLMFDVRLAAVERERDEARRALETIAGLSDGDDDPRIVRIARAALAARPQGDA